MGVGSDFDEYLDSQLKKFKSSIMQEYLHFRHNPIGQSGFPCFNIATDDFYRQKYFEVVIEDCIRRYLINGFLGRVLASQGNAIYPPSIPEKIQNAFVHVTNKEFEELVQWEFCGDFLTNKRCMIRYTNFQINESSVSEDIDEVVIINWETLGHINGKNKVCRGYVDGKPIIEYSLRAFFLENDFSEDEYHKYCLALESVIMDAVDLVGIRSTPMLTSAALSEFRLDFEKIILCQVQNWKNYKKDEATLSKTHPDMINDFMWAYHIIIVVP